MRLHDLKINDRFTLPNNPQVFTFLGCDGMYGKISIPQIEDITFFACYTKVTPYPTEEQLCNHNTL